MDALSAGIVAALAIEGAALGVSLTAGRAYARGELVRARRAARRAGLPAALAGIAAASMIVASRGVGLSAALAAASGGVALLGGLSGKPRPAAEGAALLWLAALLSLLAGAPVP